jgi:hypothetical protein
MSNGEQWDGLRPQLERVIDNEIEHRAWLEKEFVEMITQETGIEFDRARILATKLVDLAKPKR